MGRWREVAGVRIKLRPEDEAVLAELTGGSALLLRSLTRMATPNENEAYEGHCDHVFDQSFASEEVRSVLKRVPEFARKMRSGARKDEYVFALFLSSPRYDM